jgi:hypothetical protein
MYIAAAAITDIIAYTVFIGDADDVFRFVN